MPNPYAPMELPILKQINKIQRRIIGIALLALIIFSYFCKHAYDNYKSSQAMIITINRSNHVLKNFDRMISVLAELETSSRLYALTDNSASAVLSRAKMAETRKLLASVKRIAGGGHEVNMQTLETFIERKILNQQQLLGNWPEGQADRKEWYDANMLKATQLSDSIHGVIQTMKEKEHDVLVAWAKQDGEATQRALYLNIFGGVIAFVLAFVLLRRINKDLIFRKMAEATSRANESRYLNLVQNAGLVIFTSDINGRFTFVNSKCLELTGYNEHELLGKPYTFLIPKNWHDTVNAHYIAQLKSGIHQTSIEFPITTSNNESKWIEQIAVLQKNAGEITGLHCIVKDISDSKKMMTELETSESKLKEYQYRLQSILDHTTSVIFMKDLQGRYLLANKRFKDQMNVTEEQLIGKTDFDLIGFVEAEMYRQEDEEIIRSGIPQKSERTQEFKGSPISLMINKFPLLDHNNKVFGISCISTDITERCRYEKELIEARRVAESAEKLQEQFLANMSHEIRTPMNGIHGMVSLLTETSLNEEQQEFVNIIKRSSNNLLIIINDVLDLSKIKAGKLSIESIEFSLSETLENIWSVFKHRLAKKQLDFRVDVDPNIPAWLKGDPHRVGQILTNLIGNAIKFTDTGAIQVSIMQKRKSSGHVLLEFRVTDSGIGINPEHIDNIFESFLQAGDDISRKFGGTGLGLTICKQLVQLQGGQIKVISTPGSGSTFIFELPFIEVAEQDMPHAIFSTSPKSLNEELKGKRFLVVEDNLINQKVVFFTLQKVGILTDLANNGRQAVEKLEAGNRYDCIIMDLHMPEMDGYETTKYIRGVLKLETPIIAMTATVLKGESARCMECGMNDYLSKPFMPADLFRIIRSLLTKTAGQIAPPQTNHLAGEELFNLSSLEELDDQEYILEVLEMFLAETPAYLIDMKEASDAKNWEEVHRLAHKMKSGVGLIQSFTLFDLLTNIETNAQQNPGVVEELISKAGQLYELVAAALHEEKENIRLRGCVANETLSL